jgi:hypothetical protein
MIAIYFNENKKLLQEKNVFSGRILLFSPACDINFFRSGNQRQITPWETEQRLEPAERGKRVS